jgi:hypothetical protein
MPPKPPYRVELRASREPPSKPHKGKYLFVMVDAPVLPYGLARWERYLKSLKRAWRDDGFDRSAQIKDAKKVIDKLRREGEPDWAKPTSAATKVD